MFCTNCGNEIADAAVICPKCGVPVNGASSRSAQGLPTVPNHMVGAILATIFCQVTGIVAIVYAAKVNAKLAQGDIGGAMSASKRARTWIFASFIPLVLYILYTILWLILVAFGVVNN